MGREDTFTSDVASAGRYDFNTFPQPGPARQAQQPTQQREASLCNACARGDHSGHYPSNGRCPGGDCGCTTDVEDMLECASCGEVREDVGACEHDQPVCDDCSVSWCRHCVREQGELEAAEAAAEAAREWDGGAL